MSSQLREKAAAAGKLAIIHRASVPFTQDAEHLATGVHKKWNTAINGSVHKFACQSAFASCVNGTSSPRFEYDRHFQMMNSTTAEECYTKDEEDEDADVKAVLFRPPLPKEPRPVKDCRIGVRYSGALTIQIDLFQKPAYFKRNSEINDVFGFQNCSIPKTKLFKLMSWEKNMFDSSGTTVVCTRTSVAPAGGGRGVEDGQPHGPQIL